MSFIKILPLSRRRLDVLFEIYAEKEDYLRNISNKLKMNPSLTFRILNRLYDAGFLIKRRIGKEIHQAFEKDDLDTFGHLMDEHWNFKKSMSNMMSNNLFDEVYKKAKKAGAFGGKILGAGGGGFFLIYCPEGTEGSVRTIFKRYKMREVPIRVDSGGTQILINRPRDNNTI